MLNFVVSFQTCDRKEDFVWNINFGFCPLAGEAHSRRSSKVGSPNSSLSSFDSVGCVGGRENGGHSLTISGGLLGPSLWTQGRNCGVARGFCWLDSSMKSIHQPTSESRRRRMQSWYAFTLLQGVRGLLQHSRLKNAS